jgi:hypothetical protein
VITEWMTFSLPGTTTVCADTIFYEAPQTCNKPGQWTPCVCVCVYIYIYIYIYIYHRPEAVRSPYSIKPYFSGWQAFIILTQIYSSWKINRVFLYEYIHGVIQMFQVENTQQQYLTFKVITIKWHTRLGHLRGNIHTNGAHKNNDNHTTPIFIGLHKTTQKTRTPQEDDRATEGKE